MGQYLILELWPIAGKWTSQLAWKPNLSLGQWFGARWPAPTRHHLESFVNATSTTMTSRDATVSPHLRSTIQRLKHWATPARIWQRFAQKSARVTGTSIWVRTKPNATAWIKASHMEVGSVFRLLHEVHYTSLHRFRSATNLSKHVFLAFGQTEI